MKKRTRQRIVAILIVGLLGWNIYLAVQLQRVMPQEISTHTIETVEKTVVDVKTALTEVVAKTQNKVVTVLNYGRQQLNSSGSGVVYKVEGNTITLVTNHHVIEDAQSVTIKFVSGEEVDATIIGSDEYSDLAVLQAEIDFEMEAFDLGDSSLLDVGEQVLAIGSPLGEAYQGSVSYGIISGKDRTVELDLDGNGVGDWDMVVLQTDAAINPGNSGGALINLAGELIGIPSSKMVSNNGETIEGMGFAIPINEMIPIAEQLILNGKVQRPFVGISATAITDMNTYQRQYYRLANVEYGLYVSSVVNDGPAEKAGVLEGDIIVSFNGSTVKTFKEFRQMLYKQASGSKVTLTVLRDGKTIDIEVKLD